MPRDDNPRPDDRQNVADTTPALTSASQDQSLPLDPTAPPPNPNIPAAIQTTPKETPPRSKWKIFWLGVLHFDTAKMDPWIAARNALAVAIPLAVGIAIGMALGGLALASGALNVSYSDGTILTNNVPNACWPRAS